MPVVDATDLSKAYGERALLAGVSLTIRTGERVGLVGHNGSGKSTLGRILAGIETADAGRVARRRDTRCDYLPQEPRLPAGRTAREVVLASLESWSDARRRYDDLTAALARPGADAEARIASYTVHYEDDAPARAVLLCDLEAGQRTLVTCSDPEVARLGTEEELCGRKVELASGGGVALA